MPVTRPQVIAGELYHVYNRGVEKRIIFPSASFYRRFIDGMCAFNTSRPVLLREFMKGKKHTGVPPLYFLSRFVGINL